MVPFVRNVMRGWTQVRTCYLVEQTVVDGFVTETLTEIELDINIQPVRWSRVAHLPTEQRAWKWWYFIIRDGRLLAKDDLLITKGTRFRIMSVKDWSDSGVAKYEAIEDPDGT